MSSNVELHSQSRRSALTFGPISSKRYNISRQSKSVILNIFLTFVTFDQSEYRGMSTARFRVSPLGGGVSASSQVSIKLPNRAEGVRKNDIILRGRVRGQKSSVLKFMTNDEHHCRGAQHHFTEDSEFYNQIQRYYGLRQVRNDNVIAY